MTTAVDGPLELVQRLCDATNAHDVEAIVACFAQGYRNQTPAHPQRGFAGAAQVRRNWEQILGAIADLEAEVLRHSVDGHTIWTEWEHRGTRPDGSRHLMRGVIIFGVEQGLVAWARFYLEPVEDRGGDVDDAVHRQVTPAGPPAAP